MALELFKQTRFARAYRDKMTREGFMKATVAPMNYESALGSGVYNTPIDLENVVTDNAVIDGYVMNGAGYATQIQTDVETGAQPDQGTMIYTHNGHSISFLLADMAYLRTDTRVVTAFGGGLDYTTAPPILAESTRDLGSHAGVASEVITCSSNIRWAELQPHAGANPELSHAHHGERYKIMVKAAQAYYGWIETNDPPAQTDDTLAGCLFEVDWSDIPHVYLSDGTEVDPLLDDFVSSPINNNEGGLYLRDEVGGLIAFIADVGRAFAQESPAFPDYANTATARFWTDGGTSFMYLGQPVVNVQPGGAFTTLLVYVVSHEGEWFGNDSQAHSYGGYYYVYPRPIGATIGNYGAGYTGQNGFRFESPVPRGASLIDGSEYATLQLYASTNFSYNVAVTMDAWTDVQVPDGERFSTHNYFDYDYTMAPDNTPFLESPNWSDSAVYTTTELNTPERALDSDTPFEPIDMSVQMQENLLVYGWSEENGLRIRLQDITAQPNGDHSSICSYEARTGITPALNVEFAYPLQRKPGFRDDTGGRNTRESRFCSSNTPYRLGVNDAPHIGTADNKNRSRYS